MPGEELCVHDVGQYGFFAARKSGLHSRTFGRDNANDHSHGDAVSKSLPWHYRHQVRVVQLIISDYFAFCLILSFFSLSLSIHSILLLRDSGILQRLLKIEWSNEIRRV